MKRYPLSFRHVTYSEGPFYTLIPAARRYVVPGERLSSLTVNAKFISAVFEKANVTPMLVQAWSFYVPHRLVWAPWIDFVALDPATPTVPTTAVAWANMFDGGSSPWNVFARRAYKLIYNQYFGEEGQGQAAGAWYDDVSADAIVSLGRLLAWDQWRAALKGVPGYAQHTYTAPVSGATATISLDDFQRSLNHARAQRRQKVTGDKYVDTMRLFGVELDWRIQNAPEFLGATQTIVTPREKASSQAVDGAGANQLYKRASEWQGQLHHRLASPKAFAEHGTVMTLLGFRPAYVVGGKLTEATFSTPTDFYRPEDSDVMDVAGGLAREKYGAYIRGSNIAGVSQNGSIFINTTSFYPPATDYVPMTGSGPSQMGFGCEVQYKGLTPIRPLIT